MAPAAVRAPTRPRANAARPPWRPRRTSGRGHKNWDAYVGQAERLAATSGFERLRDEILGRAAIRPGESVLDVGAGTGLLALAAATAAPASVTALDVSAAMCERLRELAAERGVALAGVVHATAVALPFPDGSFDVVLSNYCLHELSAGDKRTALREIRRVLRPGGRLAFGDMMFGLGLSTARDRSVVAQKVRTLLRKGPAGIWRLARNGARIATGRWERPVPAAWWVQALGEAGFTAVSVTTLHHEGGVAVARSP